MKDSWGRGNICSHAVVQNRKPFAEEQRGDNCIKLALETSLLFQRSNGLWRHLR